MLTFSDGAVDRMKMLLGVKEDRELAEAFMVSTALFSRVKNKKIPCSEELASRIVYVLCIKKLNWQSFFTWQDVGEFDPASQQWNLMKQNGDMPYNRNSTSAYFRSQDSDVEVMDGFNGSKISTLSQPIPLKRGRKAKIKQTS
jgi:hypothetical protein